MKPPFVRQGIDLLIYALFHGIEVPIRPISEVKETEDVLVIYDHNADLYYDPSTGKLTDYGSNCENCDHLTGPGTCSATFIPAYRDRDGWDQPEYWVPGGWFTTIADEFVVVNPTHFWDLSGIEEKLNEKQ